MDKEKVIQYLKEIQLQADELMNLDGEAWYHGSEIEDLVNLLMEEVNKNA